MTTPRLIPRQSIEDPWVQVYHTGLGFGTGLVLLGRHTIAWWAWANEPRRGGGWRILLRGGPERDALAVKAAITARLGATPADQIRRLQDERAEAPDEG